MTRAKAQRDGPSIEMLAVAALVIGIALAIAALRNASFALPGGIAVALTTESLTLESTDGVWFISEPPPTGATTGFQYGFLLVLFGGIPAALASVLIRPTHVQDAGWEPWLASGLFLQLSSLLLTALLLTFTLYAIADSREMMSEIVPYSAALAVSAALSAWALPRWARLRDTCHRHSTIERSRRLTGA